MRFCNSCMGEDGKLIFKGAFYIAEDGKYLCSDCVKEQNANQYDLSKITVNQLSEKFSGLRRNLFNRH